MEMNTNAIQIFRPCHAALNFNSKPRHAALKPEAKAFKRWITHEVIPAIRKHYKVGVF